MKGDRMNFTKYVAVLCGLIFCVTGVAQDGLDLSLTDCDFRDNEVSGSSVVHRQTPPLMNAFAAPDSTMRDLAYDGAYLWAANSGDDNSSLGPKIYKLDPDSGTVIDSFPGVSGYPCGLAWDGYYLWHSVYLSNTIYQLDPFSMAIISSFPAPTQMTFGLAWDGTFLYAVRGNEPYISIIEPDSGMVVDSIHANYSSPNVRPFGLVYLRRGGTQIWTSDGNYGSNYINAWNFGSSSWFDQWAATPATYPCGLAHDSVTERLWVSCYDRDSIYVYDVSQTGMTTGGVKAVDELSIDVYPNPFTRQTDIRYQIPDNREHIVLKIYDITGREVKDFEGQLSVTGHQVSVVWDGRDDQNRLLGSGIYFLMSNQRGSAVKIVKSE
jgi:DNA-binding beta-propeller fold protein YncE